MTECLFFNAEPTVKIVDGEKNRSFLLFNGLLVFIYFGEVWTISEEVSRKSCKTYENIVKFKIYALLHNFQSHPVGQIGHFGGLILATGPYIGLVDLIMQTF